MHATNQHSEDINIDTSKPVIERKDGQQSKSKIKKQKNYPTDYVLSGILLEFFYLFSCVFFLLLPIVCLVLQLFSLIFELFFVVFISVACFC